MGKDIKKGTEKRSDRVEHRLKFLKTSRCVVSLLSAAAVHNHLLLDEQVPLYQRMLCKIVVLTVRDLKKSTGYVVRCRIET